MAAADSSSHDGDTGPAASNSGDEPPKREIYALLPGEEWWMARQVMIESHGYLLRPRYHPGWTPSWKQKGIEPYLCEDSLRLFHSEAIDAVRLSDKTRVFIKRVAKSSQEIDIMEFLNANDCLQDTRNHCARVLDVFEDPMDDQYRFLVLPLLHVFNKPSFFSIGEALDCIRQTLEGIQFLHSKGVAHRDCFNANIMMDADALWPRGFHPVSQEYDASGIHLAKPKKRSDVKNLKYYFIDFGHSSIFRDPSEPRLVLGDECQDRSVPELSDRVPYDPFPVDIRTLGDQYYVSFTFPCYNIRFLNPLVERMMAADPTKRPTATEALELFTSLAAPYAGFRSLQRLRRGESMGKAVYLDLVDYTRRGLYLIHATKTALISPLKSISRPSFSSPSSSKNLSHT